MAFIHLPLKQLMLEQRPYLDNELSLSDLAENMDMSSHQLSQLLNLHVKQNFYDFVNSHRTEYAKQLLRENKLAITQIAYYCGFSSKASFYNAFKRYTKQSPKMWRAKACAQEV